MALVKNKNHRNGFGPQVWENVNKISSQLDCQIRRPGLPQTLLLNGLITILLSILDLS